MKQNLIVLESDTLHTEKEQWQALIDNLQAQFVNTNAEFVLLPLGVRYCSTLNSPTTNLNSNGPFSHTAMLGGGFSGGRGQGLMPKKKEPASNT